ncbi:PilX N-terminal domain-containing pilus assembly protein [Desulfocicer niacini]
MNYQQTKTAFNNSNGSTIVIVMLILAVLTILGISSINTSTIELQISHNERIYQENFYLAEAVALEGAQSLEVTPEDVLDNRALPLQWLKTVKWLEDNDVDMTHVESWDTTDTPNASVSTVITDSRGTVLFSAIEEKLAKGASLDMSESNNMYEYTVRGLCDDSQNGNGHVLIEIGYKKRH